MIHPPHRQKDMPIASGETLDCRCCDGAHEVVPMAEGSSILAVYCPCPGSIPVMSGGYSANYGFIVGFEGKYQTGPNWLHS